jgi:hypothetical protein
MHIEVATSDGEVPAVRYGEYFAPASAQRFRAAGVGALGSSEATAERRGTPLFEHRGEAAGQHG